MSKYRTCWETKPLLKEWIQPVPNDSTKAYCKACNIKLYAHRYSVLKHTSTKKHQINYEKMVRETQKPPIILISAKPHPHRELIVSKEDFTEESYMAEAIGAENNSMDECLLEESIIEGDALVYNESVDVFITTTPKETHYLPVEISDNSESERDIQPEYAENQDEASEEIQFVERNEIEKMTDSPETRTISSHILDTSLGKAVSNVEVNIYRLDGNQWQFLNQAATNDDGRCSQLISLAEFKTGIYKLHFNVRPYFAAQNVQSFYPFIEVVVECKQGEHYHVPLLLNPFGYSTYRGT